MLIQGFPAWNDQRQVTTDPHAKSWAGIAIGPGSDEGLVLIDGFPLQGGRIHPVRSSRYTVRHVRPLEADIPAEIGRGRPNLDAIAGLNLILFEDPAELGCEVARSNQNYNARIAANDEVLALAMTIPYVGRRQALFVLQSDTLGANAFEYAVYGGRYQYSARTTKRYLLHQDLAANLSTDKTLAFYIGGTDNAEEWDVLELWLNAPAIADNFVPFNVDVDTIGEIGAR